MPSSISSESPVSSSMAISSALSSLPENYLNDFSQRLNNSAALCIEVGQYDRAISSLQRALRLYDKHMKDRKAEFEGNASTKNRCQEPSLDDCIAFSEANSIHSRSSKNSGRKRLASMSNPSIDEGTATIHSSVDTTTIDHGDTDRHREKRRKIQTSTVEENSNEYRNDEKAEISFPLHTSKRRNNDDNYYVYSRPIRVQRGQEIGSILFLVILFNLALAHHLKAATMTAILHRNPARSNTISKALMMYQLIFEYWGKLKQRQEQNLNQEKEYFSIRFRMILHNNLGQIYRWTKNPTKERASLEDLLSAVLVVTDQTNQHRTPKFSGRLFRRDLKGFLTNTSVLMEHERCAQAA